MNIADGENGTRALATLDGASPEDELQLRAIRLDVLLQHLLLASPPPGGDPDVAGWIARRCDAGSFWVIRDASGICAGFAQIAGIHRSCRTGWFGLCVVQSARGRGLGRAALAALEREAWDGLDLRKLLCEVRADNAAALALYATAGYRRAGVLEAHYFDGTEFHDVLILEKLKGG